MKDRSNLFTLIGIVIFVFVIGAVITIYSQKQKDTDPTVSSQDRDTPTEVEKGVKTPRQKQHGKLFKGQGNKDIDQLLEISSAKSLGDLLIEIGPGLKVLQEPNAPPFDRQKFISDIGCEASAVIVGTPKNKTSQITEDEAFIFTDYEVTVNQILKDNPVLPVQVGNDVIVTRTGGKIKYKGHVVTAIDKNFKPFNINSQYLLFLKYLPDTSTYLAFENGSFKIQGNKVEQLGGDSVIIKDDVNSSEFIMQVQSLLAAPCINTTENKLSIQ